MKLLSSGQNFPPYKSMGAIGKALMGMNIPIWPEFETVRDFTPVPIICKSRKDPIKTKKVMLQTRSNMVFFGTQGQVTPKRKIQFEFVRDLMAVLLPASLKFALIRREGAILQTTFSPL